VIDFAGDETTSQFLRRRRRILATGKQAIVHLIEATRKPNYLVALVIVLLAAAETYLIVRESPPKPALKRLNLPEPHTISALKTKDRSGVLPQCVVPDVAPSPEWRMLRGTDVFSILMPRPWTRVKLDTTTTFFSFPTATFSDRRDNYLRVSRVATGDVGRSFIASSRQTGECEIIVGNAGSLWLFYTLPVDDNDARYIGYGDAITASGRRYKLEVTTWTKGHRDSLVSIASKALLNQ